MRILNILSVSVLIATAVAGCGGSDSTSPNLGGVGGGGGTTAPVATNAVSVHNNAFTPADITIPAGTTVTWTWTSDAVTHNVTFGDGVASGDRQANATFTRTFATPGTFSYHCTIHGSMVGSVLVN